MRTILVFLSALLLAGVATGQISQSLPPETVVVPSGDLHLGICTQSEVFPRWIRRNMQGVESWCFFVKFSEQLILIDGNSLAVGILFSKVIPRRHLANAIMLGTWFPYPTP
jgi:hypothetical protein